MKNILLVSIILLAFACAGKQNNTSNEHGEDHSDHTQKHEAETSVKQAKSPHAEAMTMLGQNHVHIEYNSPRVRGRLIFGGLVAFDEVWSTGAHNVTSISFSQDLVIEDNVVKAGKYALFTIPGKEEWTIILNKNWNQHLADDYNPKEDILKLKVKPIIQENSLEELTFNVIPKNENLGIIRFQWENVSFELKISNQ